MFSSHNGHIGYKITLSVEKLGYKALHHCMCISPSRRHVAIYGDRLASRHLTQYTHKYVVPLFPCWKQKKEIYSALFMPQQSFSDIIFILIFWLLPPRRLFCPAFVCFSDFQSESPFVRVDTDSHRNGHNKLIFAVS